jgi:hypothetical protein
MRAAHLISETPHQLHARGAIRSDRQLAAQGACNSLQVTQLFVESYERFVPAWQVRVECELRLP